MNPRLTIRQYPRTYPQAIQQQTPQYPRRHPRATQPLTPRLAVHWSVESLRSSRDCSADEDSRHYSYKLCNMLKFSCFGRLISFKNILSFLSFFTIAVLHFCIENKNFKLHILNRMLGIYEMCLRNTIPRKNEVRKALFRLKVTVKFTMSLTFV